MKEEIKNGDIVTLPTGGPKMTVGNIEGQDGQEEAWCYWFDEKATLVRVKIHVGALVKA